VGDAQAHREALLTDGDLRHIFENLRKGLVPERGLDTFAVGIEKERKELHRQLALLKDGDADHWLYVDDVSMSPN
jgi:hypothetical protein